MKEPWCHIIIVKIIIYNRHNIHLRTKQVVGLLGSSHNNWNYFASSDHIEELLGYVIRAVVVLKRKVEPRDLVLKLLTEQTDGNLYWSSGGI